MTDDAGGSSVTRVLVTGGRGTLGREVVSRLVRDGYTVRVMSRQSREQGAGGHGLAGTEWAQADLRTGEGLAGAVAGVDAIVHAASSPLMHTKEVDVDGTERLLGLARDAGVAHIVYISIVGIDRIPYPYYKHKLAAEKLVEHCGLPWTILRATQFHSLIEIILRGAMRLPVAFLATSMRFQPMDPGEAASCLCECVAAGPSGRVPDIGGPEVRALGNLARARSKLLGLHRRVVPLYIPGRVAGGFRKGFNTVPENRYGKITWEDWLRRKYRLAQSAELGSGW
jgi:uncharacterized protein YbjT (DUF2867 family)